MGIPLERMGVPSRAGISSADPRKTWRIFTENEHLFRGTPSSIWLAHGFGVVFGFDVALSGETADLRYGRINEQLATDAFRPRALFDRFRIEALATRRARRSLDHHTTIRKRARTSRCGRNTCRR